MQRVGLKVYQKIVILKNLAGTLKYSIGATKCNKTVTQVEVVAIDEVLG